ncbi:hypothetical protein N24_1328 [Corynebacterium suranareeae]|uniref:Uncharacterized protein n=1 Tax=Corynebacterium suranareeae TaxID=2506452 RepID=A0A160PT13_9CORY|nr:hypothetical protein N24_1328 [Corynebacterium suranareeae]
MNEDEEVTDVLKNKRRGIAEILAKYWQTSGEFSPGNPHKLPPFALKMDVVTHITPPDRTRSHAIFIKVLAHCTECPRSTWIKEEFTC